MKLSPHQRREIITIAKLRRKSAPLYPLNYVAALYGITRARVSQIVKESGEQRRSRYCTKNNCGRNLSLLESQTLT
jgi:hypothetical protein